MPLMLTKRRLFYVLGFLVLGLVLAEVALRLVLGLGTPVLLEKHPTIGYVFAADQDVRRFGNTIRINAHHQRNASVVAEPDTSTLRILFLGDSVTFGGTLADQGETVTAYLDAELQATLEQEVEVLNASAGSWGMENLLAYVDAFGLFASDLVVLQIGTHDLLQPASVSDPVGVHPSMPDTNPLTATSELITRYLVPRLVPPPSNPDPITWPVPQQRDQFATNLNAFDELVDRVQRADTPLLVVHTPNRDEVVADVAGRYSETYSEWRTAFIQHCAERGVPVVNLIEDWRNALDVNAYFRDGVHFEPTGNAAAAHALVPALVALVDSPSRGGEPSSL